MSCTSEITALRWQCYGFTPNKSSVVIPYDNNCSVQSRRAVALIANKKSDYYQAKQMLRTVATLHTVFTV